jgi:hypothetical protein
MLVRVSFIGRQAPGSSEGGEAPEVHGPSRVDVPPVPPGPVADQVVPRGSTWKGFSAHLPGEWRRCAAWRQAVQRRRMTLLDDLLRLDDATWTDGQKEERAFMIDTLLADVNAACRARVGLHKWWCGTEIERAWARLREVEERTVDLLPDQELPVRAMDALAHAGSYLQEETERQVHLRAAHGGAAHGPGPRTSPLRAAIVDVLRASHEQSDRRHQEARSLRNRLVLASAMSLLLAAAVVTSQALLDGVRLLPLPTDWSGPPFAYLLLVMLFGVVGSLFTAIPAMSRVPSDASPFNMPLQQAVLKLAFGALVAVTGLGIVSTEPLGAGGPASLSSLLFLALIFGAGQQAVTRYVDRRADEILTAGEPAPEEHAPGRSPAARGEPGRPGRGSRR